MSKLEQILKIEPSIELLFKGPFTEVVTADLNLKNPSDKRVCFKVKTTALKRYCVRPNSGIIEPRQSVTVAVMLQPFEYDPTKKNKHKFMVQTMFVPDGEIDNQDQVWRDVSPDKLMESRLKCVLDPTGNSVSDEEVEEENEDGDDDDDKEENDGDDEEEEDDDDEVEEETEKDTEHPCTPPRKKYSLRDSRLQELQNSFSVEAFKQQHLELAASSRVAMRTMEEGDVPPPPSPPKSKTIVLPPNWKTAKDAEGKMFFYHTVTRQTQWNPPNLDTREHVDDMDHGTPTMDDTTSTMELGRMAKSTEPELSLRKGSDLIYDYCCNVCEENGPYNKEAQVFCEQCAKCYCDKCVGLHNQLFSKHSLTGRKEQNKWKVTKATVDALVKCPEHNNEIVKSFCENHQQLLCHDCLLTKHRRCSDVVTIVDKVNGLQEKGDIQKASRNIDALQGMLSLKIHVLENDIQSLQETYKKILNDIRTVHRKLSKALKKRKTNTIKELDALMANIKTSIESDTEQCTKVQTKMQCFQDKIKSLEDNCEAMSFIMYTKSLDLASETDTFLKHMKTHNKVNMTFTPDTTIRQTLFTRSGLGKLERLCKVAHPPRKEDIDSIEIDYGTYYDIFNETDKIQKV